MRPVPVETGSVQEARRPVVVFDLDGTLVDSVDDIIASFRHAFGELGLDAPKDAAVRSLVGRPLDEMFSNFARGAHVAELAAAYRRHYPKNLARRSRVFSGVIDVLQELRADGYGLAVATTKGSEVARALVRAVGLSELIDHVQGTDGIPHKPAPDVILRAADALGGRAVWMVGDTTADIEAGRAAGAFTFGVTWGTHDRTMLLAAGANCVGANLAELPRAVLATLP